MKCLGLAVLALVPWCAMAAETAKAETAKAEPIKAEGHWAFRAPRRPPEPAVRNVGWVRTPIDSFILARLEREGLPPAPEADRATLLRRLSFDLLGLPPSPQEMAAFLADPAPDAYEKVIEQLLSSPHYGERWGRLWLDVVAYADSNGYFNADSDRPLAWKYRDYVVRSLNADKPFDQFVREQLAGDELAGYVRDGDVTPDMVELLTASHLLRNAPDGTGESDGNNAEVRADRYAVLEGTVQVLGSAFLGLTVQCARCHDHKFEPVTMDDYYGLQAILKPIYNHEQWLKPNERVVVIGTKAEREENKLRRQRHERELKAMKESLEGLAAPYRKLAQEEALERLSEPLRGQIKRAIELKEKDRDPAAKALLKTNDAVVSIKKEELARRFPEFGQASASLEQAIEKHEQKRPAELPQLAIAAEVTADPPAHQVLKRGLYAEPIRPVVPAGPKVLGAGPCPPHASASAATNSPSTRSSGRRLAFARWVTSAENPVFARLMVNRLWQGHFGVGLVATADNFGLTGAKPTHPELLDWLATEWMASGYRLKAMHRLMARSAVYRQASRGWPEAEERDPDNHWLGRSPLRRLDAESLRDAMLSVSGELDGRLGGAYVAKNTTEEGQVVINETKAGAHRRSLYLQQHRSHPVTFVDLFDGVRFTPNCIQRSTSTIALQSLAMLNSDFARARGAAFGRRLRREGVSTEGRLELAFQLALGRSPLPPERATAEEFLAAQAAHYTGRPDGEDRVWADFAQMLLAGNAFLYVE